jgi:hypothetical protein
VAEIANVKQNLKMLVDVDPNAGANRTFFIEKLKSGSFSWATFFLLNGEPHHEKCFSLQGNRSV